MGLVRANTSFHCELPDGTERFVEKGSVNDETDPVVRGHEELFSNIEAQPQSGYMPVARTSTSAPRRRRAKE